MNLLKAKYGWLAALLFALDIFGQAQRPSYRIDATVDYDLLTLKASCEVTVPAAASLRDAVFFLYANASGILDDERRKYLAVDSVSLDGETVPFSVEGPILRVSLKAPQTRPFALKIDYHGVVPRSSASAESTGSLLGALGGKSQTSNNDFGLYAYSGGVLSLGSFWYPQLAVRKNGKWVDEAPKGLGDVSYAEASDFDVTLTVPAGVKVVTSGTASGSAGRYTARNVRDFAVLMSEDYVCKAQSATAAGKAVTVEACATKKNAAQLDRSLDVASHALQIYSRRFGPYPYDSFKVVEGTIRGGAGGMEFSGLTAIAPMLYVDWNQQIQAMSGLMGIQGLDKVLGGLAGGNAPSQNKKPEQDPASPISGLAGFLGTFLGQQKDLLDSVLEMTIAHEAAHQWWAIAVGSDSVREPFVDESLTNYSAVLYFEDRYGKPVAEKMMNLHLKMPYSMLRMFGEADAPANLPTSAYQSNLQYSAVVYGKGALYYDALRRSIGDEAFFSALREYYRRYRGSLAGSKALLEIVQAKAPAGGADKLYRHWIEETHGDEDIGGGQMGGLGDLLGGLLQMLGNPEGKTK